ncbi:hypothetical protein V8J38_11240 [Brevundimonas olei]|uniref:Uncharacterized protein n=1 Tax=Brevundimonas olei TaxID=657642 RepID=A0ABZ2IEP9_9CAUL
MNRLRALYREWLLDRRVHWIVRETRRLQAARLRPSRFVLMSGNYVLWLASIERSLRELDDEMKALCGDDDEEGAPEGVTVH